MQNLAPYRKALIVPIVGIVLTALGLLGFTPEMTIQDGLVMIITTASVYWIPNKKN